MLKSQLVDILSTFSTAERGRLSLFLDSPYFTNGRDSKNEGLLVQLIFEALDSGEESPKALKKKELYKSIYPGNKFVLSTINNLGTSTKKLVCKFIVQEMMEKTNRPTNEYALLVQFFQEKGAFQLCDKFLTRLEQQTPLENSPDHLDFLQNWQAEDTKASFLGMKTDQRNDYNLLESLRALELFYLVKRLEILTSILNQHILTPILEPHEPQALTDEIESWKHMPGFDLPLVRLSRKVLLFLQENGSQAEQEFDDFQNMLLKYENHLSLYFLKRLETLAYNFCARRFSKQKYRKILFDLFRRRIQPDRLNREGTIQAIELLSMVKTGLLGGEFELVASLLETFKNKIKGRQDSEDYYKCCKAFLLFYMEKFEEASSLIQNLVFVDTTYKYFNKVLEIKLLYELGPSNDAHNESRLLNLRVMLTRERNLPAFRIKAYRNFVTYALHLIHWRMEPNKDLGLLQQLHSQLLNEGNIVEKIWLEKTIRGLLED